jgi:hypothetical protein
MGVSLPTEKRFETLRRMLRQAVTSTESGREVEQKVEALLGS